MLQIWGSFNCERLAGKGTARVIATGMGIGALLFAGVTQQARAATLCVNPGHPNHCFTSIGAAVAAASPGDTIRVAHGTYAEYVVVPKPLSLIGDDEDNTIIDASNKPFGINVDGFNHHGLRGVVIAEFTVRNANNAGIVISNAWDVTISGNSILNNDKGLVPGNPTTCPSLSSFPYFTGEAEDCGEGILLSGVRHSILADNTVTGNAGGILITDDTGATHDNLITGNSVVRNTALDCGITLPSHSEAGVFHNTVSGNDSSYNGGPGVGIFAPGPGSKAYGNVIINNHLKGNGLPGVTMHNHAAPGVDGVPAGAPPPRFNDNVIVGNEISDNAQDTEDAATAGPTGINIFSVAPMTGTLISQNVIHDEAFDIVIKVPETGNVPAVQIHLNNFAEGNVGVQDAGATQVDATQNWWGCRGGPATGDCATVSGANVIFTPWLRKPFHVREDERDER
jgi:parallel beta-helix repeat protein